MKKPFLVRSFAIINLLLLPCTLHGQSVIYEHLGCNTEMPFIKHYKGDVDISYHVMYTPMQPRRFCYIDRGSQMTYEFDVPDFSVGEYEIFDDKVYFCGTKGFDAVFGYFDIDSVFFHNGQIHYFIISSTSSAMQGYLEFFTGMSRLEVYRVDDVVHVVMVGVGKYVSSLKDGNDKADEYYTSVIIDAWLDPVNGWQFDYTMDYEMILSYDDIAVTDKYVVVVANYHVDLETTEHCILHYYKQSTGNANVSIFPSSPMYTPLIKTPSSLVNTNYNDAQIVATKVDSFATVCVDFGGNNLNLKYTVSLYSDPSIDPYQRFKFSDTTYSLADIAYNRQSNRLCMVRANKSCYLWDVFPFATNVNKVTTGLYPWLSVDSLDNTGGFILAGLGLSYVNCSYWMYPLDKEGPCVTSTEIVINTIDTYQGREDYLQNIGHGFLNDNPTLVKVYNSRLLIECK